MVGTGPGVVVVVVLFGEGERVGVLAALAPRDDDRPGGQQHLAVPRAEPFPVRRPEVALQVQRLPVVAQAVQVAGEVADRQQGQRVAVAEQFPALVEDLLVELVRLLEVAGHPHVDGEVAEHEDGAGVVGTVPGLVPFLVAPVDLQRLPVLPGDAQVGADADGHQQRVGVVRPVPRAAFQPRHRIPSNPRATAISVSRSWTRLASVLRL